MVQRKALFSVAFALTRSSEFDRNPTWSPDGKKIAFDSDRSGNLDIWRMKAADGSNPVRLTSDPAIDIEPSWQPLP